MMFMFPLLLIPESLLTAINMLIYDESLSDSHPDLQMTLLGYLQQMKQDRYDARLSESLQQMDQDRYDVYVSSGVILLY